MITTITDKPAPFHASRGFGVVSAQICGAVGSDIHSCSLHACFGYQTNTTLQEIVTRPALASLRDQGQLLLPSVNQPLGDSSHPRKASPVRI